MKTCYKKYLERKILDQYATVKCNSSMYPQMSIYATACNNVIECVGEEDERNCRADNDSLLIATSVCVLLERRRRSAPN